MATKYLVEIGLNYPDPANTAREVRAEPGDIISDLPNSAIQSLLAINAISPIKAEKKAEDR